MSKMLLKYTVDESANEPKCQVRLIAKFPETLEAARVRRMKEKSKRPVGNFWVTQTGRQIPVTRVTSDIVLKRREVEFYQRRMSGKS